MSKKVALSLVVVGVLFPSCQKDNVISSESAETTLVSQEIGVRGGQIVHPRGATLTVPPLVLDSVAVLSAENLQEHEVDPLPGGMLATSDFFAFKPHGQKFKGPVDVALAYSDAVTPAIATSVDGTNWEVIPGAVKEGAFVHAYVEHFSFFVAVDGVRVELCNSPGDEDEDGAADCDDTDCKLAPDCGGSPVENCRTAADDDGDGDVNCRDADCLDSPDCQNVGAGGGSSSSGGTGSSSGGTGTANGGTGAGGGSGGDSPTTCPASAPNDGDECAESYFIENPCNYDGYGCACLEFAGQYLWKCRSCPSQLVDTNNGESCVDRQLCEYDHSSGPVECSCYSDNKWACSTTCPTNPPEHGAGCYTNADHDTVYQQEYQACEYPGTELTCDCRHTDNTWVCGSCPESQPNNGDSCPVALECVYGTTKCECDRPDGGWSCK